MYPNSSAFATPKPNVTSGVCFCPLLTITRRSPSKSKANPKSLSSLLDISSFNGSVVGSGPLEFFSRSLLIVLTSQPIISNNLGETVFAAPPPTSTVTLGESDTSPITFAASFV